MELKKRILVIDDDKGTRVLLTKILTEAGYNVVSEEEGVSGLETAKSIQPDLILLDVVMPGYNGYHICDDLKSHEEFQDIPIIILTSRSEDVDEMIATEVGANSFISKPFDTPDLLEKVSKLLNPSQ